MKFFFESDTAKDTAIANRIKDSDESFIVHNVMDFLGRKVYMVDELFHKLYMTELKVFAFAVTAKGVSVHGIDKNNEIYHLDVDQYNKTWFSHKITAEKLANASYETFCEFKNTKESRLYYDPEQ